MTTDMARDPIQVLKTHRMAREAAVVAALGEVGGHPLEPEWIGFAAVKFFQDDTGELADQIANQVLRDQVTD